MDHSIWLFTFNKKEEEMEYSSTQVFRVCIRCCDSPRFDDLIDSLVYENLRFEIVMKFKWFFEYRAALMKVKNPKSYVDLKITKSNAEGQKMIDILKNRTPSKLGQVTKVKNAIEKYAREWNSLFPIDEDQYYQKAIKKLEMKKMELALHLEEIRKHESKISN